MTKPTAAQRRLRVVDRNERVGRLHRCSICERVDEWGPGWMWYGSIADMEDGNIAKVCSDACRERAEADGLVPKGQPVFDRITPAT